MSTDEFLERIADACEASVVNAREAVAINRELLALTRARTDAAQPPEPAAKACECLLLWRSFCPVHGTGRTDEPKTSEDGKGDPGKIDPSPNDSPGVDSVEARNHAARGQRSEEPRSPSGDSPAAPDVEAMVRVELVGPPGDRVWRVVLVSTGRVFLRTNDVHAANDAADVVSTAIRDAARRARVEALEEVRKEAAEWCEYYAGWLDRDTWEHRITERIQFESCLKMAERQVRFASALAAADGGSDAK